MSEKIINSEKSLEAYIAYIRASYAKHKYIKVTDKAGNKRTPTQNRCIHKLCTGLSESLNDGGFDLLTFFKDGYTVPFTPELVKDNMWRTIQKAMTGKHSTTDLTTEECSKVYEVLNLNMAGKGIYVPWPSRETI